MEVIEKIKKEAFFFFFNDTPPPEIYPLPLHDALPFCVLLLALVAYAVLNFRVRRGHTVGPATPATNTPRLEALWTVIPAIILVVVGVAAFTTLVTTDTIPQNPDVIVQINAHQWYWNFNITYVRNRTWLNSTHNFTYVKTTGA